VRLGHGVAVVVQQHNGIGEEQGAIEIGGLADDGEGVELATLDDLPRRVEVDVGELGQGDQEGGPAARAQEAGEHRRGQLTGDVQFFDIGQALSVVRRQGAVVGGDVEVRGGQRRVRLHDFGIRL